MKCLRREGYAVFLKWMDVVSKNVPLPTQI